MDLFRAMGTDVQIVIPEIASQAGLPEIIAELKSLIYEWERLLSRFVPTSDISRINRQPDCWVAIDPRTGAVLERAMEAFAHTEGLFNPCLGSILISLGYDRSFEQIDVSGQHATDVSRPVLTNARDDMYRLSRDKTRVYLNSPHLIDLGGIGKSYIVNEGAKFLVEKGVEQFTINAGGDMICQGKNDTIPWSVGIDNPFDAVHPIMTLDVESMAVATSATYKRRWHHHGQMHHHLIDPSTGAPARSDVMSCTIVHPNLIAAEVLAKTCLLLGSVRGPQWLSAYEPSAWVVVKHTGEVIHSWNL
jgi:thiamine biosynthesis lipoprotein